MIALVKSSSIINHKSPLQFTTLRLNQYFIPATVQHAEVLTRHQSARRLPQAAGAPS